MKALNPYTLYRPSPGINRAIGDDVDTNRILIQKSTILKRQTIKISRLRSVYKHTITIVILTIPLKLFFSKNPIFEF